jgi:hypothetical protein
MSRSKYLRRAFRMAAILLLCIFGPSAIQAQQRWKSLHAAMQLTVGGTDANYPGCRGVMLVFAGASVELGSPYFAEGGVEKVGTGGDSCQTLALTPRGNRLPPTGDDPYARYWAGFGRRFYREHLLLVGRLGGLSTDEMWLSAKATASIFHVTVGFEFGQIRARWEFEDDSQLKRWSKFGGVSIGLRL